MTAERSPRKRGLFRRASDGVVGAIGEGMARDPVLGPAITDRARSNAAAAAFKDTEPTMQEIAKLRLDIDAAERRQGGSGS